MCHAMAVQIVHDDDSTRYPPHLRQNSDAIGILQMVKKQRADHRIERLAEERELKSIPCYRDAAVGEFQAAQIQIQRYHAAAPARGKSLSHIASSRSHIEDGMHIGWK